MKTKAFSVYDVKAKFYGKPVYQRNAAEAIRAFETECNAPESQLCKYPQDFVLFEIGEYDDETGILTSETAHISLGSALQYTKTSPSLTNVSQ